MSTQKQEGEPNYRLAKMGVVVPGPKNLSLPLQILLF
jgi:hypothetical protein